MQQKTIEVAPDLDRDSAQNEQRRATLVHRSSPVLCARHFQKTMNQARPIVS